MLRHFLHRSAPRASGCRDDSRRCASRWQQAASTAAGCGHCSIWRRRLASPVVAAARSDAVRGGSSNRCRRHLCAPAGAAAGGGGESDRLVAWIERAMPTLTYTAEHERMRSIWHGIWRKYRYRAAAEGRAAKRWSHGDMARSVLTSHVPLKATLCYGAYCGLLTAPFMYFQKQLADAAAAGNAVAESLSGSSTASSVWDELAMSTVQHIIGNHEVLNGVTGFLASLLFLMLSFRLNRSYQRWLNGTREFADLSSAVRNLNLTAQLSVTERSTVIDIGLISYAYARSVELHLRHEDDARLRQIVAPILSPPQLEALLKAPRRPLYLAQHLTWLLSQAYDAKQIKNVRLLVSLQSDVTKLVNTTQQLQRIQSMAEPWLYLKHMRVVTQLWLSILPLALLPSLGWTTPVLAPAIGYVVYKMDDVAVELTSPFGFDRSDISICLLNDALQEELRAMLIGYVRESQDPRTGLWDTWGGEPPED